MRCPFYKARNAGFCRPFFFGGVLNAGINSNDAFFGDIKGYDIRRCCFQTTTTQQKTTTLGTTRTK
jgi:hypothetical protein